MDGFHGAGRRRRGRGLGARVASRLPAALLAGVLGCLATSAAAVDLDAFDHWATGFPLTGAHLRAACESCHRGGVFRGTPRTCALCHAGQGGLAITARPQSHVPSSNRCDDCHSTQTFSHARFEHREITQPCFGCHNGSWAASRPGSHLPTSNRCDDCHNTLTFARAVMSHIGIATGCVACHDNRRVSGKVANHIPTHDRCETCHNTAVWAQAQMDHTGIVSGCFTCHNNQLAPGKHPGHIPAPDVCEACHLLKFTDWKIF